MGMKFFFSLLVAVFIYAFFFGPLIPFNPIKIGYTEILKSKAVVYIRDINSLQPFYQNIDQILLDVEEFTGLKYKDKVQVLVALEYQELGRYIPWLNYTGLGGVSLQEGNMVYINAKTIAARNYNEEEFVKHEVVHTLISQNTNLYNDFTLNNQHWVSEGVAGYFGGPYYYTTEEFKELFRAKKLVLGDKGGDLYTNLKPEEAKFNYSLYRYFVGYVIQTHGRDKFKRFLHRYIQKPEDYAEIYSQEFDFDLYEDLRIFEQKYREVLP